MKTNNITKKLGIALVSLTLLVITTSAKPFVKSAVSYTYSPLSVKYFGMKKDYLLFRITVKAGNIKKPELFVDESSAIGSLYWKKLYSTTNIEWVRIKKADNLNLRFELVGPNKSYYKTFTANTLLVPQLTVLENKDLAAN
jgi:hypothetical protein